MRFTISFTTGAVAFSVATSGSTLTSRTISANPISAPPAITPAQMVSASRCASTYHGLGGASAGVLIWLVIGSLLFGILGGLVIFVLMAAMGMGGGTAHRGGGHTSTGGSWGGGGWSGGSSGGSSASGVVWYATGRSQRSTAAVPTEVAVEVAAGAEVCSASMPPGWSPMASGVGVPGSASGSALVSELATAYESGLAEALG